MLTPNLRNYLFLLSALWVFACSQTGIQSKKDGTIPVPIPDCQRNCIKEGGLISRPVYKTSVKYDHLEFKKGFDLAVRTLQSQGHWILLTDPGSGTISAQMFFETEQAEGYPATIKIVEEESSLVVHASLKATWGTVASPDLCRFYDEFGKNVKQASIRTETKQPIPSSQKLPDGVIESNLPSPSPPPAATPKISLASLSRGKVIWVYVNLREGPGIQYKIIGRAYMNNTFEILAENPGWLWVRLEKGKEGWMSKKAASESTMTPSSQSPPVSSDNSSKTRSSSRPPCPM